MSLDTIIDGVIAREGSAFTDRKNDRGGPTRFGVTLATLTDWRQRTTSADDVKALTETEARDIYRQVYAIRPGFVKLTSDAVLELAIDCAVHHGPREGVKLLQVASRVFPDGTLGNETASAANRMTPKILYQRLCAARVRYCGQIITRDPSQAENAAGWFSRIAGFIESAP